MFCTSCGSKNNDDANFCKQCGLKLDRSGAGKITEQQFERAMPDDEQVTAILERAYRARKDGDRAGAIALCREALNVRPQSTSCHSLLGQLYEQGGERELAVEQYEQVLALNPGSIADRVKLDELRGDVPSVVNSKRVHPNIVLADRSKDPVSMDYRVPSFVLAGVALMVLGGIFTMQMLAHQNSSQRAVSDQSRVAPPGNPPANSTQQNTSAGTQIADSGYAANSGSAYSNLAGAFGQQQPIINVQPPQIRYVAPQGSTPGPTRLDAGKAAQGETHPNSQPNDDGSDMGSAHVMLTSGSDGSDKNSDAPVSPISEPKGSPRDKITISQPSNGTTTPTVTPGSDSRKSQAIADNLMQQGQYKQAGNAYVQALSGAGADAAYVYRQAAWCFEKAGEKETAKSYYNQGIDAARKMIAAGQMVEIANNLIRQCQTGIKACTN